MKLSFDVVIRETDSKNQQITLNKKKQPFDLDQRFPLS